MSQDGLSDDVFPEVPRQYSQFEGTRCALPMLADVYGLYYNKDLFAKAGLDGPPQTVSQLMDYAKKLTERNPDGSLKVVGLDPFDGFYENIAAHWAPQWGVDWVDESGKSNSRSSRAGRACSSGRRSSSTGTATTTSSAGRRARATSSRRRTPSSAASSP